MTYANPRLHYTAEVVKPARKYNSEETDAIKRICNQTPVMPGGPRCCFPKCHHGDCRAEIRAGLEAYRGR